MVKRVIVEGQPTYLSTGHFVEDGSHDHFDILATPGLSLRDPDGTIIDGTQE
jgi:hypothetical protein